MNSESPGKAWMKLYGLLGISITTLALGSAPSSEGRPSIHEGCAKMVLATGLLPPSGRLSLRPRLPDDVPFDQHLLLTANWLLGIQGEDLKADLQGAIEYGKSGAGTSVHVPSLQLLYYQLRLPLMLQLEQKLNQPRSEKELVGLLDAHFKQWTQGEEHRPEYSFADVLQLAREIRGLFLPALHDENYLEMFGSTPNLAGSRTSDINLFLSPSLRQKSQEAFETGLRLFRAGEVSVYPTSDEAELDEFNWIQPLSIRILRDAIVVRIHVNDPADLRTIDVALPVSPSR